MVTFWKDFIVMYILCVQCCIGFPPNHSTPTRTEDVKFAFICKYRGAPKRAIFGDHCLCKRKSSLAIFLTHKKLLSRNSAVISNPFKNSTDRFRIDRNPSIWVKFGYEFWSTFLGLDLISQMIPLLCWTLKWFSIRFSSLNRLMML